MDNKTKGSLFLLIICIVTTIVAAVGWPENENMNVFGLLSALGSVISFFAVLTAIFGINNDTEDEEEE